MEQFDVAFQILKEVRTCSSNKINEAAVVNVKKSFKIIIIIQIPDSSKHNILKYIFLT